MYGLESGRQNCRKAEARAETQDRSAEKDKLATNHRLVNDCFRTMTLSRNPELWQSLPAEKQHKLENTPEFLAIEEEMEQLSLMSKDDPAARVHRKELYTQKRKPISEELRRYQKVQPKKLLSKTQKIEQVS